ncbi:antitermination protein Q [Providencia sp. PROV188]|uniref:antiterminator Q family protein n=1 Tax=Providencia sp. PROV188 TaxID=2939731 RepID=UPI0022DD6BB2|nr:antiterminator Q family protein [Providencia sp. PROV188]WBM59444.1 antitermination protein Q [Providencia sp. PROV188]
MNRDIQKILVHWGGWSAGDHYAMVGWSSVAAGFNHYAMGSRCSNRLSCSDEDGLVIDLCVAKLSIVGMERERAYLEEYYIKGQSKRAIGRKFKIREGEVRERMQSAESFVLGFLEALNIQLDMDLLYEKCSIDAPRLVRAQNLC